MVGPSVFPDSRVEKSSFETQNGLFRTDFKAEVVDSWLVLQYFQIHKLYRNGWSFSISRKTSYIRMAGPSVFPDSQVLRMAGPSVCPDSQVLRMVGPSVFADSLVLRMFGPLTPKA